MVAAADVVGHHHGLRRRPLYPGKRYLDWELADPHERSVEDIRPIRDEIDRRVRALVAELVPDPLAEGTARA